MSTMGVSLTPRRFTVDEYHRMAEAGILGEDDRVELLDGEIVEMAPIGPRHAAAVARLAHLFGARLGDRAIVWVQNPVVLGRHWEPQPDLVLLRPRDDFYAKALPRPEDMWLVIEVAETSAEYDRRVKLPAYAPAGVPEAWLLDLPNGRLEVRRDPDPGGYRNVRRLAPGEGRVRLEALEVELSVEDLVGP